MQLTALVTHPEHVCCRYRLAAFRTHLETAGHQLTLVALPRTLWSRLRLFQSLRGATVIVQRKLLPGWERLALRRAAKRLIFDFDDAVFLRDSYSSKGLHDSQRLNRFAGTVRACDAVIAGNSFLGDAAARWIGPERVRVIPTCIEPLRYQRASHERCLPGVRLVWIGSSSTLQGLEAIAPLLEQVGQRVPGLELQMICDRFLALRHLPVVATRWSEDREASDLAGADIGISWIPDDAWSRGKCGLKVLQYMAAGLPVVTNPVGVHAEMVRHGETGFLVQTPEDWVEAIARLASEPHLRRRLGTAGRQRLEDEFSVAEGARRWCAAIESLERVRARAV